MSTTEEGMLAYEGRPPRVVSAAEIDRMTEEEFEEVIASCEQAPLILTSVDPETGGEISARVVPLSMIAGLLEQAACGSRARMR